MAGPESVGPVGSFSAGPPDSFTTAPAKQTGGASITIKVEGASEQ
jgi:hypothetical protein